MYYLYNDTGICIDEYENVELGLGAKSMFPDSILLYYSGNRTDVWEHGIELYPDGVAPEYSKEFIYWMRYTREKPYEDPETGHIFNDYTFSSSSNTLESALEALKNVLNVSYAEHILDYGIEERQITTYKVKL